jgi:uncharacterized protein (TIGR01777 family)
VRVLVTGASGFIGSALTNALVARGDQVIAWVHRSRPSNSSVEQVANLSDIQGPVDAVVNLAGAPIADARWSDKRKALLLSSRIDTTRALVAWIASQPRDIAPKTLISGSAIGIYGATTSDEVIDESSSTLKEDFSASLCRQWEAEALKATQSGTRVCLMRTGIVLGKGGALAKMRLPFLMGGGGPIASGEQWMPWIHLDDEVDAIIHLLDRPDLEGAFNLTAPDPARNKEFVRAYAESLKRFALIPMPALAVNLMLGSEASALLTEGLKVMPSRLEQSGFHFTYPLLENALKAVANSY